MLKNFTAKSPIAKSRIAKIPVGKNLGASFCRFGGVALLGFVLALSMAASAVADSGSRSFEFSYVVKVEPPAGSHKIHGRIRLPSTDYFQTISQMQLQAPEGIRIRRESQDGESFASFSGDSSRVSGPIELRVTFHVLRYEQRLDLMAAADPQGPPPKPAGPPAMEVAAFLAQPDDPATVHGAAGFLGTQTLDAADPVVKARQIYNELLSEMSGDHGDRIDAGANSASAVECGSYNDDCKGMNSRFVASVRAVGIPARLKIGFSLPSGQNEGVVHGYHDWAEFYVNGMGWIPVDVSQALQEPDKRDDFFGQVDTRCVMISSGRDTNSMAAPASVKTGLAETPGVFDARIDVDGKEYAKYSQDFFFAEPGIDTTKVSKKPIYADGSFRDGIRLLRVPS